MSDYKTRCKICLGVGRASDPRTLDPVTCPACGGTGVVEEAEQPKILFIGGYADGQKLPDIGTPTYRVHHAANPACFDGTVLRFKFDDYTRQAFSNGAERVEFYLHEDMSHTDAMHRLLLNYRPGKDHP